MWRLAKALIKLREQVNLKWPKRDRTSDGSIGDAAHAARKSDHDPNSAGVVTAIDIDADLTPSQNVGILVAALCASRDKRIKYIIWNAQITVKGSDLQQWKPYTGINAHKHHAHISVSADPELYDDDSDWQIDAIAKPDFVLSSKPTLRRGSVGKEVQNAQERLIRYAFLSSADGRFGPDTEAAVKAFQTANGITADGVIGKATWSKLLS